MHVQYMMLQMSVCISSRQMGHRVFVQAEVFWQTYFGVALFLYISVYYVCFMSSACADSFISLLMPSEKGVL